MRDIEKWLDVTTQKFCFHHHGVTTGDEDAANLRVVTHILDELAGFPAGKLKVRIADELCPPETVGAVGMAGLALCREKQDGLIILVLHALQRVVAKLGFVQFQLTGRVRVQLLPHLEGSLANFRLTCLAGHEVTHVLEIFISQHFTLGECELEYRVGGKAFAVNEILHHIIVYPEGQDSTDSLHVDDLVAIEPQHFANPGQVISCICSIFRHESFRLINHPRKPSGHFSRVRSLCLKSPRLPR